MKIQSLTRQCAGGDLPLIPSRFPSRPVDLQDAPTLSLCSSFPFTDYKVSPWGISTFFNAHAVHYCYYNLSLPIKQNRSRSVGAHNHSAGSRGDDKVTPRAGFLIPELFPECHAHPGESAATPRHARGHWTPHQQVRELATRWCRDPAWLGRLSRPLLQKSPLIPL